MSTRCSFHGWPPTELWQAVAVGNTPSAASALVTEQPGEARDPLQFEVRRSDAPLIDCVWRCRSSDGGDLVSVASSNWHLVIGTTNGRTEVSVRGPETGAIRGPLPLASDWVGIRFGLGVTLQGLPIQRLVNESLRLPEAGQRSFGWKGTAWRLPTYDNVEGLVERLSREGLLSGDPVVKATARGDDVGSSLRTVQRRFLSVTGLTRRASRQIERARYAAVRLREGAAPAEVAHELGYSDQPHLTRSLRRFLGHTPAQISDPHQSDQMSLLFKTDAAGLPTVAFDRLGLRERHRDVQDHFGDVGQSQRQAG